MEFSANHEKHHLNTHKTTGGAYRESDGMRELDVDLYLPKEQHELPSEASTPSCTVMGIWAHKFSTLICEAYKDTIITRYHWFPFKLFCHWATPSNAHALPEHLYSNLYSSDVMIKEHKAIQSQPQHPDDPWKGYQGMWPHQCLSILTQHTSRTLGRHRFGQFTYSLATSQSISG